jgi:uncharacterized protein
VKIVDANVLLYAVNSDAMHHERSQSWLDGALSGGDTVGFAWIALLAFIRLSTKVGLFPSPLSLDEAMNRVDAWLGAAPAVLLEPAKDHARVMRRLLHPLGTGANLVNDAHLAALAIEHDAGIVSFDNNFSRFAGVPWQEPPRVRWWGGDASVRRAGGEGRRWVVEQLELDVVRVAEDQDGGARNRVGGGDGRVGDAGECQAL